RHVISEDRPHAAHPPLMADEGDLAPHGKRMNEDRTQEDGGADRQRNQDRDPVSVYGERRGHRASRRQTVDHRKRADLRLQGVRMDASQPSMSPHGLVMSSTPSPARAGVETGANMLGVWTGVIGSPPLTHLAHPAGDEFPCPAAKSNARANAKRLLLLRPRLEFTGFLRRVAKNDGRSPASLH